MSRFFCDADCELDYKIIEELNITLIKMPYTVDGAPELFDCGKTTDFKGFYDKMRGGSSVKTQALNENDYIEYFEPVFAAGEDILYVSFSHKMSGTFSSMEMALKSLYEKYPDRKCTVVDTESISMGAGYTVYYAALLHNKGYSDEEVVKFANDFKNSVDVYFTVEDLEYLKRGGRLSAFKATMGNILNLKPVLAVRDGTLVVIEKVKGRKNSLNTMLGFLEKGNVDLDKPICILSADCDEGKKYMTDGIKEKYPNAEIIYCEVGPVIGCHCGPDTIGMIFVKK